MIKNRALQRESRKVNGKKKNDTNIIMTNNMGDPSTRDNKLVMNFLYS